MDNGSHKQEYAISFPYITSLYLAIFSLICITSIFIDDILGEGKIYYNIIVAAILLIAGLLLVIDLRKDPKLIIEENRLIIDGTPLESNEIIETTMSSYFIQVETTRKQWSQRKFRLDFKKPDREMKRKMLKAWLERNNVKVKIY